MAGTKYFNYMPINPTLRDAAGLSAQFGNIDYDEASIKRKFDAATAAEYLAKNKEFRTTEDLFYNNVYGLQKASAQNRSPYASAIMNGQNMAAMVTPQLASMMNLQSQSVTGATELARARNLLKDQEAAAYTTNTVTADTTSSQRKFDLSNLAANLYGSDMQGKAAADAYWAALEQGQAALEGTKYASEASVRAAQIAAAAYSAAPSAPAKAPVKSSGASSTPMVTGAYMNTPSSQDATKSFNGNASTKTFNARTMFGR